MKKTLSLFMLAAFVASLISGCSGKTDPPDPKAALLHDVSGVWVARSDNTMFTIDYTDKKLRFLVNDDVKMASVGDIDTENETVNLQLQSTADNHQIIWTLKRIWDDPEKKASFHLGITFQDGTHDDLNFVRKISTDDQNRIARDLASETTTQQVQPPPPENQGQVTPTQPSASAPVQQPDGQEDSASAPQ